jgi:hypothetical protein
MRQPWEISTLNTFYYDGRTCAATLASCYALRLALVRTLRLHTKTNQSFPRGLNEGLINGLELFASLERREMICSVYKIQYERVVRSARKAEENAEAIVNLGIKVKFFTKKDWGSRDYDFLDL